MREFIVESLLPFVAVGALIAGLTRTFFDVPGSPPPARAAPPTPSVTLSPAEIPDTTSRPLRSDPRREQINEVLARAVRTLSAAGPTNTGSTAGSTNAAPAPTTVSANARLPELGAPEPPADPKLFGVVSKLSEAMRIARDARDDSDLAKAEELMRSAREEMDSACDKSGGGGPLCQSASQIRSLGY